MRYPTILVLLWFMSCSQNQKVLREVDGAMIRFDLQGHRGARGIAPENSIPGFRKALDLNVTTLELDLAVTKDSVVILSHEPWFSSLFCLDSLGLNIPETEEMKFNIFQMTYDQVKKFDCGSIGHPRFPEQKSEKTFKPKLIDVFRSSEEVTSQKGNVSVSYNIEIKSQPRGDNLYHPEPKAFSDLVYRTIDGVIPWDRITIQSFDFRVLRYFHETYPEVTLAALVENDRGINGNLDELGFNPDIYSCYHKLLDQEKIEILQNKKILVIPWTVNEIADMEQLYDWGVDGLITDYPNRFWESKISMEQVIDYLD